METTRIPQPKRFFLYDLGRSRFVEITPHLASGYVLGREEGNETFPDDDTMSHAHARVSGDGESGLFLEDLGSTNGTRLNLAPLAKCERRKLALHDIIGVGNQNFILTNQNLYRPAPAQSLLDLTQVREGFEKMVAPERPKPADPEPPEPIDPENEPTVVAPSKIRHQPAPPPEPKAKKPRSKLSPLGLVLAAVLVAMLAFTLFGPSPRLSARKPRASASAAPATGASRSNAILLPNGRESYWEAFTIEGNPDILYLKNVAILTRKAPFLAMHESIEVLKRFLALPQGPTTLALGESPELEALAGEACSAIKARPGDFPAVTALSVLQEASGGRADATEVLRGEQAGPLGATLMSTRLATIRFPLLDGKIDLASTVFHCTDMVGQRLNLAQSRAWLFHLIQAREALAARLLKHERQMVQSTSDKGTKESIKAMRLSVHHKAIRNLARQNEAYLEWLGTPEAATTASPEALELLRSVSSSFASYLKSDVAELTQAYEKGRFVYPIFYPALKTDATLEDGDLLFLSAY